MMREPITLTFDLKQYHPFGFNRSTLVRPMTFTPVSTNTSDGELVRSVSAGFAPMPNTLTDVESVLYVGLEPKGCLPQALRQLAIAGSTVAASDGTLIDIAMHSDTKLGICLKFIVILPNPM